MGFLGGGRPSIYLATPQKRKRLPVKWEPLGVLQ